MLSCLRYDNTFLVDQLVMIKRRLATARCTFIYLFCWCGKIRRLQDSARGRSYSSLQSFFLEWHHPSEIISPQFSPKNQPQTPPSLNLMEEEPLYGGRALNSTLSTTTAAACLLHHPTISNSLNRSLTLSLSRYTARLIAGEHQIVVGDFPELRSDSIDWTYTKHFVLDVIWNLPFFLVSVCVLLLASNEKSSTALRVWISGYALQCLLRLGFTFAEYLTRNFAVQDWVFSSQSRRR